MHYKIFVWRFAKLARNCVSYLQSPQFETCPRAVEARRYRAGPDFPLKAENAVSVAPGTARDDKCSLCSQCRQTFIASVALVCVCVSACGQDDPGQTLGIVLARFTGRLLLALGKFCWPG